MEPQNSTSGSPVDLTDHLLIPRKKVQQWLAVSEEVETDLMGDCPVCLLPKHDSACRMGRMLKDLRESLAVVPAHLPEQSEFEPGALGNCSTCDNWGGDMLLSPCAGCNRTEPRYSHYVPARIAPAPAAESQDVRPTRSAEAWLAFVNEQRPCPLTGVTPWFSGALRPERNGWYERQFTDGVYRQWWNGAAWLVTPEGPAHWRQVDSYPCWRGLLEPAANL